MRLSALTTNVPLGCRLVTLFFGTTAVTVLCVIVIFLVVFREAVAVLLLTQERVNLIALLIFHHIVEANLGKLKILLWRIYQIQELLLALIVIRIDLQLEVKVAQEEVFALVLEMREPLDVDRQETQRKFFRRQVENVPVRNRDHVAHV